MRELKTLFGYPVNMSNIQVDDIICFTGVEWVNAPFDNLPAYVGLGEPLVVQNENKNVFTLDGLPVIWNSWMNREVLLGLVLVNITTNNGIEEKKCVLSPAPLQQMIRGRAPVPTLDFFVQGEADPISALTPLPASDFSVV